MARVTMNEDLDVEALIETLSQLMTVNDTEAVRDELSKLVATLRSLRLEASTKKSEKVDELALPQPVQEPLETQPPVGIRRENSGQVEGVWLVVRQPVEEHGQPAEEDVQRAPEHVVEDTPADAAVVGKVNPSALLVLHDPPTGHQQNGLPTHAVLRHNPEPIESPHPRAEACHTVPDASVVPNEPRLSDRDLEIGTGQQETDLSDDTTGETQDGHSPFAYRPRVLPPHPVTNNQPKSKEPPVSNQDCAQTSAPSTDMPTIHPHNDPHTGDKTDNQLEGKAATGEPRGQKSVALCKLQEVEEAVCRISGTPRFGNGLFTSIKVRDSKRFFLLTCCHVFLEEGEDRKEMTYEEMKAKLMLRCKEAKFEVWVKNSIRCLTAEEVLVDYENPVYCSDQEYDLLAIKVRDPAEFAAPFPLMLKLSREMLLEEAQSFCIVHIPSDEDGKPRKPEITMGNKYIKPTADPNQAAEVRYIVDTRKGSSGAPLLYSSDGGIKCLILMGVHVRGAPEGTEPPYKVAAVLTQDFFEKMKRI